MAFSHRVALSASLKITVFRVEVLTNGEPYKIDAAPFTVRGSIYIHIYIYNIYMCVNHAASGATLFFWWKSPSICCMGVKKYLRSAPSAANGGIPLFG